MPEVVNNRNIFSLLEVMKSIQKTLAERYKSSFWVKAEMNKLNFYKQSGHCYPELVEKQDGRIIAQVKSNLWNDDYNNINTKFLRILKEPLKDGIKILFLARISFDPSYGLALRILDIDPSYTLGDLEREKQETIKRLQEEGIYNKNKSLKLPLLPQRIAIISVETSKGYADFLKVMEDNSWNYKFFNFLFPSLLQGEKAVDAIIEQLQRINKVRSHFDVVAIIRGGGGDIGLSCYNNYSLSKAIALFPIPIITGIGHATNETVSEMVSFYNAITPTKLAEYLIQKFHNYSDPVQKAKETIIDRSRRLLRDEKNKFQSEVKLFRYVTENILIKNRNDVRALTKSLFHQCQFDLRNEQERLLDVKDGIKKVISLFCNSERQELKKFALSIRKDTNSRILTRTQRLIQIKENLLDRTFSFVKRVTVEVNSIEKNVINMSPQNVLRRGYSITLLDGKAVKSINEVTEGSNLKTIVLDGNIISIVKSTNKTDE